MRQDKTSDVFGQISRKIAILLNIGSGDNVLLIGKRACAWAEEFRQYFCSCNSILSLTDSCPSTSDGSDVFKRKYTLVVWDLSANEAGSNLQNNILRVVSIMNDKSSLMLFAPNRFSVRRNFKEPGNIFRNPFYGSKGYRLHLKKVGFEKVMEFLPLPNLDSMEEVVESKRDVIQLPSHFHIIMKFLNHVGLYKYVHDYYFYIASRVSAGINQLILANQEYLSKELGLNCNIRLERFDLRQRGALVVMLQDTVSGQRFVARATTSPKVKEVVSKNALWIEKIRLSQNVSETVKLRIPQSFGKHQYEGNTIYIEEFIEGCLAWKFANNSRLKQKLLQETYSFIYDFNKSTCEYLEINEKLFSKLAIDDTANCEVLSKPKYNNIIKKILPYLEKTLLGSKRFIVWGHGDFGYGNIIVNPGDGKLAGVIDWDTGRDVELAGIDLLNFLVQRYSIENVCSSLLALQNIGEEFLEKGFSAAASYIDYDRIFMIEKEQRVSLMALFCLRKTFRAAKYPVIFERHNGWMEDLIWIIEKLK